MQCILTFLPLYNDQYLSLLSILQLRSQVQICIHCFFSCLFFLKVIVHLATYTVHKGTHYQVCIGTCVHHQTLLYYGLLTVLRGVICTMGYNHAVFALSAALNWCLPCAKLFFHRPFGTGLPCVQRFAQAHVCICHCSVHFAGTCLVSTLKLSLPKAILQRPVAHGALFFYFVFLFNPQQTTQDSP